MYLDYTPVDGLGDSSGQGSVPSPISTGTVIQNFQNDRTYADLESQYNYTLNEIVNLSHQLAAYPVAVGQAIPYFQTWYAKLVQLRKQMEARLAFLRAQFAHPYAYPSTALP